jgi:N-acetylglucosamine kinase-like BadF-type ATPase
MVDGKTHVRYKATLDQDDLGYEVMMSSDVWRKKGSPIQIESKSEGLEDVRSLTGQEIVFHAEAIDALMGDNRNRQGCVVIV